MGGVPLGLKGISAPPLQILSGGLDSQSELCLSPDRDDWIISDTQIHPSPSESKTLNSEKTPSTRELPPLYCMERKVKKNKVNCGSKLGSIVHILQFP